MLYTIHHLRYPAIGSLDKSGRVIKGFIIGEQILNFSDAVLNEMILKRTSSIQSSAFENICNLFGRVLKNTLEVISSRREYIMCHYFFISLVILNFIGCIHRMLYLSFTIYGFINSLCD